MIASGKNPDLAMKRGSNALEDGSLCGDNMMSVVHRLTGIGPGMPLQYADQTAALQLGHFAPKSALGAHVTRLLVENETDPGISSLRLSEAVRKAAASCHARRSTIRAWPTNTGARLRRPTSASQATRAPL
jgi:hypothetical protein